MRFSNIDKKIFIFTTFILFYVVQFSQIIAQNNNEDKQNLNRLAQESSPYLLQHKNNPVDWYPWGPEAFNKAIELDRPIFLSIGYSTYQRSHVIKK